MFRAVFVFILLLAWPVGAAEQRHGRPVSTDRQAVKQTTAQAPPRREFKPWWQDERYKSELHMTADQAAKIEEIWQAARPRLQATFEDVNKLEDQMARLFAAKDTTELDVIRQLTQVQAARSEADRQRTLALFRMQRVLTPEQRAKFKAMRDQMREQMDRERREGRRGPERPHPSMQTRK